MFWCGRCRRKEKEFKNAMAKIKELESEVRRLKTPAPGAAPPSDATAMAVDAQGPGAQAVAEGLSETGATELRRRLKSIDEQLAALGKFASDEKCAAYVQGLRAEKETIHQRLQASRPMYAQLQTLSVRLKSGQQKMDKMREGIAALQGH